MRSSPKKKNTSKSFDPEQTPECWERPLRTQKSKKVKTAATGHSTHCHNNETNHVTLLSLSSDSLALIVSFCDFLTGVRFVRCVHPKLCRELDDNDEGETLWGPGRHIWKESFDRHGFAPDLDKNASSHLASSYLQSTRYRRQLAAKLFRDARSSTRPGGRHYHPFSLPEQCFHFLPIVPKELLRDTDTDIVSHFVLPDDPPPVNFDCDSFLLTSPGSSPEWFFLDPFNGTLALYENILDTAIRGDNLHAMMVQHKNKNSNNNSKAAGALSRRDSDTAGAVKDYSFDKHDSYGTNKIEPNYEDDNNDVNSDQLSSTSHSTLSSNASVFRARPVPQPLQEFISILDYWALPLEEYFPNSSSMDIEVEIDEIGTECKIVFKKQTNNNDTVLEVAGTMVSLGRSWYNVENDDECVAEVLTWYRSNQNINDTNSSALFGNPRVCRLRSRQVWVMELCAAHTRLFVNFARSRQNHDRVLHNNLRHRHDDENGGIDESGSSQIHVFPLVPYPEQPSLRATPDTYFPQPEFVIDCYDVGNAASEERQSYYVVSMATTSCGSELIIGMLQGAIQIWNVDGEYGRTPDKATAPVLLQHTKIAQAITHALTQQRRQQRQRQNAVLGIDDNNVVAPRSEESEVDPLLFNVAMTASVETIRVSQHLDTKRAGFVTLQHDRAVGSTLLLWRKSRETSVDTQLKRNDHYGIVALINLPLLARREPKFQYDGRRLVVFGQDHIGFIILVYHVFYSQEDAEWFSSPSPACTNTDKSARETSGGVVNLSLGTMQIRFANRIRHAALGGIQEYESIHMTMNERFLVVNTKTGNLLPSLESSSPCREGLLVIDLHDEGC